MRALSRRSWVLVVAAILTVLSCSKPASETAEKAPAATAAAVVTKVEPTPVGATPPSVGEDIFIMGPKLQNADFMVIYKHSHHAYIDSYGFDTEVFRFNKNPQGGLVGVSISKVQMDGEAKEDYLDFSRSDGQLRVESSFASDNRNECEISTKDASLVAQGDDFQFTYSSPGGASLRIERRYGKRVYSEEWNRGTDSIISDTMDSGFKGRFEGEWPKPRRYIETSNGDSSGGADAEFEFFDLGNDIKFAATSAEPLSEVALVNIAALPPGGLSLEDVALIDIALGGDDRRITPLLARLYLGSR